MNQINKKSNNKNLQKAKNAKNDEFYTQLEDIEREVKNYKDQLKDKVIYCNCDNPEWSNFWKYFKDNFKDLGIKKLISTYYEEGKITYKTIYDGKDIVKTKLKGDGDFRSDECLEILKTSDVVITNPPFSLFREFIDVLIENNKEFIIIGSQNAITYKETFNYMKNNKLWLGYSAVREFKKPDGTVQKFGNICWFTNLKTIKRKNILSLNNKYSRDKYPKYDNFDAINVNKITEIPYDYNGIMGVPITFMDKYNPKQFKIVGNEYTLNIPKGRGYVNGKKIYSRIFIKKR